VGSDSIGGPTAVVHREAIGGYGNFLTISLSSADTQSLTILGWVITADLKSPVGP